MNISINRELSAEEEAVIVEHEKRVNDERQAAYEKAVAEEQARYESAVAAEQARYDAAVVAEQARYDAAVAREEARYNEEVVRGYDTVRLDVPPLTEPLMVEVPLPETIPVPETYRFKDTVAFAVEDAIVGVVNEKLKREAEKKQASIDEVVTLLAEADVSKLEEIRTILMN